MQDITYFYADSFDNFSIFEDSNLSKIGLPKAMIRKIHTKEEHYSQEYPQMGHTYKSRAAIPMPYKYFIPSPDVEIPDPIKLRGRKSNRSPFQDKEVRSEYTDFAWYLQSIPFGEIRIFVVNPDIDFFMFLYHKQPSKGATGEQYAVMAWDPERRKVIDYGYSELTTSGVDRSQLRTVHDTKGGNTNGKIQEFVRAMTKKGEKKYAPSLEKPLWIYTIPVTPQAEPRIKREERTEQKGEVTSVDFLKVFIPKFANLVKSMNPRMKETLMDSLSAHREQGRPSKMFQGISEMFDSLNGEISENRIQLALIDKFIMFRKELFEEGRGRVEDAPSAYKKTSGFELKADNSALYEYGKIYNAYNIQYKKFSPDEEGTDPETGFREAQPEKYRRSLPIAGGYASIASMIAKHTLDGLIDKFIAFIVTGKIKTPSVSVAGLLGISTKDTGENEFKRTSNQDSEDDSDSWLF